MTPNPFDELADHITGALTMIPLEQREGLTDSMLADMIVRHVRRNAPQRMWLDAGGQASLLPTPPPGQVAMVEG